MPPRDPRQTLLEALREHALVIGRVTLASGREAEYYVDCKRALFRPEAARACGALVAGGAGQVNAGAVGGLALGAVPIAALAVAAAAESGQKLLGFYARKEFKGHGLERPLEGAVLADGVRCLVVEDVVTTGGSTLQALERARGAGLEVAGVLALVDRLAGGGEAIGAELGDGVGYRALFTIDEIHPERPDR